LIEFLSCALDEPPCLFNTLIHFDTCKCAHATHKEVLVHSTAIAATCQHMTVCSLREVAAATVYDIQR
jgi:hypothetical protein